MNDPGTVYNYVLIIKNEYIHGFDTAINFDNPEFSGATIEINKIEFQACSLGISFFHVSNAKVTNCIFYTVGTGSQDTDSVLGNLYSNLLFSDPQGTDIVINTDENDSLSFDRLQLEYGQQ